MMRFWREVSLAELARGAIEGFTSVRRVIVSNWRKALEQPGAHIGGWSFENNVALDVSVVHPDELTGLIKAKDASQKAIWICPGNGDSGLSKYGAAQIERARAQTQDDALEKARGELGAIPGAGGRGAGQGEAAGTIPEIGGAIAVLVPTRNRCSLAAGAEHLGVVGRRSQEGRSEGRQAAAAAKGEKEFPIARASLADRLA
jgi:hypothetical protein